MRQPFAALQRIPLVKDVNLFEDEKRPQASNACHKPMLRIAKWTAQWMAPAHEVIMSNAPIAIIGTGIAGAHIVGGRSLTGAHGSAVELGHVVVRPGGAVCGCGQRGCVEAHGSAIAFEKRYLALAGQRATAEQIIAAAGTDAVAAQAWRETIDVLADGLLVAVAMLDPDTIVVGGGLASAGDALLSPLSEALRARATFHSLPSLVVAELGDVAGCIGAAILGLERLEAQNEQV